MVVIAAIAKEVRSLKWRSGADAFPFSVSPIVTCALLAVGAPMGKFYSCR